jgi:hypothetical protein
MPTVVVYRPRDEYHGWLEGFELYKVAIDDHLAGEVGPGHAAKFYVLPGEHTIRIEKDLTQPNGVTVILRQRSNTVAIHLRPRETVRLSCLRPGILRATFTTWFLRGSRYFDLRPMTQDEPFSPWRGQRRPRISRNVGGGALR